MMSTQASRISTILDSQTINLVHARPVGQTSKRFELPCVLQVRPAKKAFMMLLYMQPQ
jgi:hypothetical protein